MGGILILLTGLRFALASIRYQTAKGDLERTAKQAEKDGVKPEIIFARRDGKNYNQPEEVKAYAAWFDRLEKYCNESRLELAGMVGSMVKHEKSQGMNISHLEGLETLSDLVESGFERHPADCIKAYNHYTQANKQ